MTDLPANDLCSTCQTEIDVYACNAEMCRICKRLFCYECSRQPALFEQLVDQCADPCEPPSPLEPGQQQDDLFGALVDTALPMPAAETTDK